MKARLTSGGIPPQFKKDIDKIFRDYELRYKNVVTERMMAAMLLAVSDVFGFGHKRMNRLLAAFWEIIKGYSEEAYEGVDKYLQSMETMNNMLREELADRGILIRQDYGNLIVTTVRGNEKNGRKQS